MSKVCLFKFLQLQSVQNPLLLSKDVFEYIFTKREAHKMSKVCLFKFLKLQSFQNPSFLSKDVFEYISTKREVHKMSKVCLFKKKVQKTVFGWVISSYKSHLLLSVSKQNCGADINDGTFKCKFFVDRCCKTRSLSKLYFPTKVTIF